MKEKDSAEAMNYQAPEHLSERSRALWTQLVPSRARSAGRLVMLEEALAALDRADECRQLIREAGLLTTTATTGAVHVHPLAKLERESRQQFTRAWGILGLEWDGGIDGRSTR